MILGVTYHESREAGENPEGVHFGFVYFNDDRRVAYTDLGVDKTATGGHGSVTDLHVFLATNYLESLGNILGTRVTTG